MELTQEKLEKIVNEAIQKATEDSTFREELKQNPKEALEKLSGLELPEGIRVDIVDMNENDIIIPLPKSDEGELSDADLEGVSGGTQDSIYVDNEYKDDEYNEYTVTIDKLH